MPRVKLYAPGCDERYCFSISDTVTVAELIKIVESRLGDDIEHYKFKNCVINLKLRLQDGFEYKIFGQDLVNNIITPNDVFIVNFESRSRFKSQNKTHIEERKVTRLFLILL